VALLEGKKVVCDAGHGSFYEGLRSFGRYLTPIPGNAMLGIKKLFYQCSKEP